MKKVPALRDEDSPSQPNDERDELATADPDQVFAGHDPADIFRRLIAICLPASKTYGGARRWRAGYNRMVAISYHVAPEQFLGMTQDEVAASLNVTPRAFRKQLAAVSAMLAARVRDRPPRGQ